MSTLTTLPVNQKTASPQIGSIFVSNYPPYSVWDSRYISAAKEQLSTKYTRAALGLYIHIPFCRQRCDFCWYKVYADKASVGTIRTYLEALLSELQLYTQMPGLSERVIQHIHFGGGTPSLVSTKDLRFFLEKLWKIIPREHILEVTFECEPGTLTQKKVSLLKQLGVTRVSLGIQTFNDLILRANGRLHTSKDSLRAMTWVKQLGFEATNIDLLAGLPGDTTENWHESVRKILDYEPEGVSLYQMELPHNTIFANDIKSGASITAPSWETKRAWINDAFDAFLDKGYEISDSRSVTRIAARQHAAPSYYQDGLNRGLDLLSIGASPFGIFGNIQYQNEKSLLRYLKLIQSGELALVRACIMTRETCFLREVILGLKTGALSRQAFRDKFELDPLQELETNFDNLLRDGLIEMHNDSILLTRRGLIEVDFWLPRLYQK